MKYCVFGFDSEFPKTAKAKNNLSTDPFSLEKSYEAYQDAIKSEKYKSIYFLVDFGWANDISFWKAVDINYFGDNMIVSWILISMHKNGEEINPVTESVHLELKGFSESYKSVYTALVKFNKYLEMKIKCDFYADIFRVDKFITNTGREIHKEKRMLNCYCRKYKI
jgi:hypothetical protein